jgi:hypothetical protein
MKAAKATRREKTPNLNEEHEQILKKAQVDLLFEAKRPMLAGRDRVQAAGSVVRGPGGRGRPKPEPVTTVSGFTRDYA